MLGFKVFWGEGRAVGFSLEAQKLFGGHRPLRGPDGVAGGQAGPSPPLLAPLAVW